MVKQSVVCIWLMVAIVMQSFIAVADSTNDLELAVTHIETEHEHRQHVNETIDNSLTLLATISMLVSDESEQASLDVDAQHDHSDCHHCGHCSTPHGLSEPSDILLANNKLTADDFHFKSLSLQNFINNTYRPPIV